MGVGYVSGSVQRVDGEYGADFVRRLSAGDPEVEKQFVHYFGDLLRIRLHSRFRDPQWIDDVSQETLFRVLRTIRQEPDAITQPDRFGHYVHSVCRNVILERFRGDGKYQRADDEKLDRPDPAVDHETAMITDERKQLVRRLLDELPGKDRLLLTEVFLEERDKDEICRLHAVDRGYLRVLMFRARQRFRDLLGKKS